MSKINVKESISEIVKKNNLEILKIDLINDEESFVRLYGGEKSESCKIYTTLEDLDFEVDSIFMQEEVQGTVYCQDKDTKEPVWIISRGDECSSWWEVNKVPESYKSSKSKTEQVRSLLEIAFTQLDNYNKGGATQHSLLWKAMGNIEDALKELED